MSPDSAIYWVNEREAIRLKKEAGYPRPWTEDPILSTYRFCNVRREDDRVTRWIDQNIRQPFAGHEHLWFMLCTARQINWPDTLAELIASPDAWPSDDRFSPERLAYVLEDRAQRGDKVFTGAYIITAPPVKGSKKTTFVAQTTLGELWRDRRKIQGAFNSGRYLLQQVHQVLIRYNGWGPFLAYQAVVDMRFTRLLCDAADVSTWAAAGPGTIRGLNRLSGRRVTAPISQSQALYEMRLLYPMLLSTGVQMDFSDVPNVLCETDKHLRVKNGEGKPRALYVPGRGS